MTASRQEWPARLQPLVDSLRENDPELLAAVDEVDMSLLELMRKRSPLERLRASTQHLRSLRRFQRDPAD